MDKSTNLTLEMQRHFLASGMRHFKCECGHEVYSNDTPLPMEWTNGHKCKFKVIRHKLNALYQIEITPDPPTNRWLENWKIKYANRLKNKQKRKP